MLDTIKLYTSDFTIQDGACIQVQPGQLNYESGVINECALFSSENGAPVYGAAAFIRDDERYHLQIQPKGGTVLAFVNFSVPRVINGENYYPVSDEESGKALELVNSKLWERGVHMDLNSARLSRVDMFKNAYTSEPFGSYRPVFELLQCKRQLRRDYGTTYLWSNTQRELCVYSKLEEMARRQAPISGLPDTTRFELRFMNAAVTKKMLGFSTAGELVQNLDHVKAVYSAELAKNLFALAPGEVEILVESRLERELRFYKSKFGRQWQSAYQLALGAHELLVYGEDALKKAFSNLGAERVTTWRWLKRINQNWQTLAMLREEPGEVKTLGSLYGELKQLVLGLA